MPKTLWRAAKDDYIDQGTSFAARRSTAKAYLDNPGYGGGVLYRATGSALAQPALDLRGKTWCDVRALLDVSTPSGIGLDEWLPRAPAMLDKIRSLGYLWALVDESYPADTTTWIWTGTSEDEEPEMEPVSAPVEEV